MKDTGNVLEKLIKEQPKLQFNQLDNELKKYDIPKDVSEIIFSYYKPVCDKCNKCCPLCSFYCFYGCLREERDLCCNAEYLMSSRRYDITKQGERCLIDTNSDSDNELVIQA